RDVYTLDKRVYTNSFGFRDGEWKQPKGSGVIRIMCLGDSLTFGNAVRVEETYPKVLEKKLRTQFGDCEVITAAVGGWSLYDEYNFLTAEGYKYQPDIIVLGFYINDFFAKYSFSPQIILTEDLRLEGRPEWLRWLPYRVIFLLKRSALLTFLRDRVAAIVNRDEDIPTLLLKNKIDLEHDPNIQDVYATLLEMRDFCAERNIRLIVASIPPVNLFWFPKDSVAYIKHFQSFCESNNLEFIDLSKGFWDVKDTDRLYMYPWDGHLSPEGHVTAAGQLVPVLVKHLKKNGSN
ncbi:MAG TPA: SGNH/GDSL hydrolase family protein, partial [Syntrophales bacterium]|nr:SGNH/GDSL hydrolase family protein [Syntrophales bacterium]